MAVDKPSFLIGEEPFPIPAAFTLADGPLVYEASGLEFAEFAERMDGLGEESDMRALTALVAIAVSRARPHWPRKRVVQFLGTVDLEAFKIEGGDDADPPAEAPTGAKLSPGSSTESTTSPADMSEAPV